MKKGIIIIGIICIALITTYSVNQVIYLSKVQYTFLEKKNILFVFTDVRTEVNQENLNTPIQEIIVEE